MHVSPCALSVLVAAALPLTLAGEAPAPGEIAPGIYLVPGEMSGQQQPDGNSVLLRGAEGLILVDTGRHAEHTRAALDFAASSEVPIRVVINTHWHLDHIGGNPRVRASYPEVRILASNALAGALKGFLADYRSQLETMIPQNAEKPALQAQLRGELEILDAGPALAPDEVVKAPGPRRLAGREVVLHLESHAVTAGDVWLFDPATRTLVAGDLVTLPAPLLDTACPEGWKTALEHLAAEKFDRLVPGHGEPLTRELFETYRTAFAGLLACAASEQPDTACVDRWFHDAGPLGESANQAYAHDLAAYYVSHVLRGDPEKLAARCGS